MYTQRTWLRPTASAKLQSLYFGFRGWKCTFLRFFLGRKRPGKVSSGHTTLTPEIPLCEVKRSCHRLPVTGWLRLTEPKAQCKEEMQRTSQSQSDREMRREVPHPTPPREDNTLFFFFLSVSCKAGNRGNSNFADLCQCLVNVCNFSFENVSDRGPERPAVTADLSSWLTT